MFPEDIDFVLKKMFWNCGTRDVGDILVPSQVTVSIRT